jgi:hypothetical protein
MSATAAFSPDESNRGGRRDYLGFFIHLFSLDGTHFYEVIYLKDILP